MNSQENEIIDVAIEINNCLSNGVEIFPRSSIHKQLIESLIKYANNALSNYSENERLMADFINKLESLKDQLNKYEKEIQSCKKNGC